MKKLTSNKQKGEIPMAEEKKSDLLEKTCQRLAENASEAVSAYEEYLLDQRDSRSLAKIMTKLRTSISGYFAAGGK